MSSYEVQNTGKRILVTGSNSYVGKALMEYLKNIPAGGYQVDCISLRDDNWKSQDFGIYDTIFHMVGIAHADVGHASMETRQAYYNINRDLAVCVAKKAKKEGVKQFVYMSSVIVYGDCKGLGKPKHIVKETKPEPSNFYGDSKWQAEQELSRLQEEDFAVAIVRCPMVYGKNSKGNFRLLRKMALKLPIFPKIRNQRSMIYIENLTEFLRLLGESQKGGIFFPQNEEYVNTALLVKEIAKAEEKRILVSRLFNPFVYFMSRMPGKWGKMVNKAFGSVTIDKELSNCEIKGYQLYSFEESVRRSMK